MKLGIYYSTIAPCNDRSADIRRLLNDVPIDRICSLVLFCLEDETGYHNMLREFRSCVHEYTGKTIPVTLVPQPLLPDGGLSAEIYTLSGVEEIHFHKKDEVAYGIIENSGYSMIFIEGVASSVFSDGVRQQSREVFLKLDEILTSYGFSAGDIVRQWNYIGNITSHRNGRQNYQEFNDARSAYYMTSAWSNGYPAATGIGASCEGIIVGCIAFKSDSHIYPINNPLQIAAHEYSRKVLVDDNADALKTTPKFERAKLIEIGEDACCFVSGTAAIRGELSMDMKSARSQTIQTIENIEYLVSKENLIRFGCKAYDLNLLNLRVYIKNAADYDEVKATVDELYPQIPAVYTIADVCRDELLVEIEGILIS